MQYLTNFRIVFIILHLILYLGLFEVKLYSRNSLMTKESRYNMLFVGFPPISGSLKYNFHLLCQYWKKIMYLVIQCKYTC